MVALSVITLPQLGQATWSMWEVGGAEAGPLMAWLKTLVFSRGLTTPSKEIVIGEGGRTPFLRGVGSPGASMRTSPSPSVPSSAVGMLSSELLGVKNGDCARGANEPSVAWLRLVRSVVLLPLPLLSGGLSPTLRLFLDSGGNCLQHEQWSSMPPLRCTCAGPLRRESGGWSRSANLSDRHIWGWASGWRGRARRRREGRRDG